MLHESRRRGALAEILVAYRFLETGRLVSWPLVPCAYDLVVDGGDRFYRVQVKQAHEVGDMPGHWSAGLFKRRTGSRDKLHPITALDVVCVVTTPAEIFVIPVDACASPADARFLVPRLHIGPLSRYRLFLNRFALGTGMSTELTSVMPVAIAPVRVALDVPLRRARGLRKRYRRLTAEQIDQIRQLPIRWYHHQPAEGRLELVEVARQFDVCPATLRNVVLRRERLDLKQRDYARKE